MTIQAALDRLCAICGIGRDYADIWGNRHTVPERTQRALLGAMGIPADSDEAILRALERAEHEPWRRLLPPVTVVREHEAPFAFPLTLPNHAPPEFSWTLTLEGGERHEGSCRAADLPLIEQRQTGDTHYARRRFELPLTPGPGYHRLEVRAGDALQAGMSLIVAPDQCYRPGAMEGEGRVWGTAAQLYGLRSQRNWGIGDFGDLRALVEFCAEQGAGVVGVSPIHALFPDNPEHASPYGPSSRLFLNVLHLDVEAIPDFAENEGVKRTVRSRAFQAQLRALRAEELVQYGAVAAAKLPILERLYAHFREHHLQRESERGRAFRAFLEEGGLPLQRQALFEALQAHFRRRDASVWGWPAWPEPYRDPDAPEVAAFLEQHRAQVEFHAWLQWQAELQLAAAGRRSWELGLGVGLLLDLAVSINRGGGESWASQSLYALEAGIGAPPDDFSLNGQDWGLPPLIPHRLREAAYAPFIATLRASMRHAGALRIDHVMGLYRLFWVPPGGAPADGAYVYYPFSDLLGILALESQRNRCLVVGEDLGTVPDEVRDALHPLGVLSYRLLYFEKDDKGAYKLPADYPEQALVAVTTHDLATLAGFWQGRDIEMRNALGLFPSDQQREAQIVARAQDCARLLVSLEKEGLLPPGTVPHPVAVPEITPEFAQAIHGYLARSSSRLMLVQLEDLFGQLEQVNLPGTTEAQFPNWRRKLALNLEEWRGDPRVQGMVDTLRRERGSSVRPQPPAPVEWPRLRIRRVPDATYRLQLNREFTFSQAAGIVDYLSQLGISHCYASPILKARPGSAHGYDIIDHRALNPEIGGADDFARFAAALRAQGMGLILDIVPNHMGIMGQDNAWWLDVLENGPASVYAQYFDIDWFPQQARMFGRVLLPVLGGHYGAVLENGELRLAFDAARGEFSVYYYEHRFPIDPGEYPRILGYGLERLGARLGAEHPHVLEFQSLVTACGHLPKRTETEPEKTAERNRDKEIIKQHLATLSATSADIVRFIEDNVAEFNAGGGVQPYQLMHELLEAQCYRLAYWRVASDEINYRRFFDINDLAALRMENPEVFEITHGQILDWLAAGTVDGLRIDHMDGLYDPFQYLQRLQQRAAAQDREGEGGQIYVVVEKILAAHEHVPDCWPIAGTTGYDFMNQCNGLFVSPAAADTLEAAYVEFTGDKIDFEELRYASKRLIMKVAMAGELNVLAHQLARIAAADRHTCDFTVNSLRSALAEVVACFPVYRTYISADKVSADDIRHVDWAVAVAKKRSQGAELGIYDFIRDVLLRVRAEGKNQAYQDAVSAFAMKFQQYTSPVMAKGMEDTAFYLYNRLVSLNEVGGDPRRFGVPPGTFHKVNQERAKRFPHAMLATSTHDSKRSEDVRARIDVLSELPDEWRKAVARWSRINQGAARIIDGREAPSRNDEYLLYQTLVGVWPLGDMEEAAQAALCERVVNYMLKAVREAKAHSSWVHPNAEYEEAVMGFVRALFAHGPENRFLPAFLPFQKRVARLGLFNSLAQLLLKLTAPGVPDIYQGNELWDFSLVDPDNRRPVDYSRRQVLLAELQAACLDGAAAPVELARDLLDTMSDGRIKLYLTWRALSFRREHAALFRAGDYLPLKTSGRQADHLCAFARQHGSEAVITAVPRLVAGLMKRGLPAPLGAGVWKNACIELPRALAGGAWINLYTQERLTVHVAEGRAYLEAAEVFRSFPCALLVPAERG